MKDLLKVLIPTILISFLCFYFLPASVIDVICKIILMMPLLFVGGVIIVGSLSQE